NVLTFRPCDPVETAECYQVALETATGPSVMALSRQNLPVLRTEHTDENLSGKGGYVMAEADGDRKVTIIATGSEVSLAMEARAALQAKGVGTAVVSMPCTELFDLQPVGYRRAVLGDGVRVAVEALGTYGWERYVGDAGAIIGMTGFGASAPAEKLYEHFGITAGAVVDAAMSRL
ncbi:MAG: transketolase, partial [Alphaproteobacteria bacterium]|nr:transketolase [Alphaproteobacteria bacterium]